MRARRECERPSTRERVDERASRGEHRPTIVRGTRLHFATPLFRRLSSPVASPLAAHLGPAPRPERRLRSRARALRTRDRPRGRSRRADRDRDGRGDFFFVFVPFVPSVRVPPLGVQIQTLDAPRDVRDARRAEPRLHRRRRVASVRVSVGRSDRRKRRGVPLERRARRRHRRRRQVRDGFVAGGSARISLTLIRPTRSAEPAAVRAFRKPPFRRLTRSFLDAFAIARNAFDFRDDSRRLSALRVAVPRPRAPRRVALRREPRLGRRESPGRAAEYAAESSATSAGRSSSPFASASSSSSRQRSARRASRARRWASATMRRSRAARASERRFRSAVSADDSESDGSEPASSGSRSRSAMRKGRSKDMSGS